MSIAQTRLLLLADAPEALIELCGVTLLERHLRIAHRLGFTHATILSTTAETIRGELARPSWARGDMVIDVLSRKAGPVTAATVQASIGPDTSTLLIPATCYCDARLLPALSQTEHATALVDSSPPPEMQALYEAQPNSGAGRLCGPVLLTPDVVNSLGSLTPWLEDLARQVDQGRLASLDAASYPAYIPSMRRSIRPLCFPVRDASHKPEAERVILDAAQNGTLDVPAYVHAPIETALVARLCRISVTPNQVTLAGFALGLVATALFFTGHVVVATILALIFGVVDGMDGKLARVKIETTPQGKWEHNLDFAVEYSWWIALALYLQHGFRLPYALAWLALLLGSDLIDREAKRRARLRAGRLLDDFRPFDRVFRLVSGRRNIYIWMLAAGLIVADSARAYVTMAIWAALSAAVHVLRAVAIARAGTVATA